MPDLPPLSRNPQERAGDLPAPPAFGVDVAFDAGETVVSVRGDVDRISGPVLSALLHALIDPAARLSQPVVLDLARLTFMDAAGLVAIVAAAQQLAGRADELVIRSAPDKAKRMMDATGVTDQVTLETGPLHVEMARLHDPRAQERILDAALRLVTGLASTTLVGAQGVSVSLHRDGRFTTVAATDETVSRMDDHQYATGEGPCLSAAAEGRPILVPSLPEEERWPAFVPRALEEGITSILSSPLVVGGRAVGALNVYADGSSAFGVREQELAALFASEASGLLADVAVLDDAAEQSAVRIRIALATRELIARAQGVVMARHGVTAIEAAARMHRAARAEERSVAAAASALLASVHSPDPSPRKEHDRG